MKKLTAIIAILILVLCSLSACGKETYEDGYADGYADGHFDAEVEMEYLMEDFLDDYDNGYDDGYEEVYNAIEDASYYARRQTGWTVYEAWNNIRIYQEGVHPFGYELPTRAEYHQSVETLVLFCEHLDSAGFRGW